MVYLSQNSVVISHPSLITWKVSNHVNGVIPLEMWFKTVSVLQCVFLFFFFIIFKLGNLHLKCHWEWFFFFLHAHTCTHTQRRGKALLSLCYENFLEQTWCFSSKCQLILLPYYFSNEDIKNIPVVLKNKKPLFNCDIINKL